MLRSQQHQPLPAHSKHTSVPPFTHAHPHLHPLHFLPHDPRMLHPGMPSLPVPTMQLMMSHHDVIMKQYNKAVAERLAKIVEDRTKGTDQNTDRLTSWVLLLSNEIDLQFYLLLPYFTFLSIFFCILFLLLMNVERGKKPRFDFSRLAEAATEDKAPSGGRSEPPSDSSATRGRCDHTSSSTDAQVFSHAFPPVSTLRWATLWRHIRNFRYLRVKLKKLFIVFFWKPRA